MLRSFQQKHGVLLARDPSGSCRDMSSRCDFQMPGTSRTMASQLPYSGRTDVFETDDTDAGILVSSKDNFALRVWPRVLYAISDVLP